MSRWLNGNKYSGLWRDGKANGVGKYTFKSGASVDATFCDNKAQGDAVLIGLFEP